VDAVQAAQAPSVNDLALSVEITRRASCDIHPRDHLYEEIFYLIERITNRGTVPVTLLEEQRSGALVFRTVADAENGRPWLDFVGDYESRARDEASRYTLAAGETHMNETAVSITVREPGFPATLWPLGSGRHVLKVESVRLRELSSAADDR
jgi:hypothetical protein